MNMLCNYSGMFVSAKFHFHCYDSMDGTMKDNLDMV